MFFASLRASLASLFFRGYTNMPKLFHTRTNISETVKNVTVETNYLVEAIQAFVINSFGGVYVNFNNCFFINHKF